jgi:hypothetical protein
VNLDWNLYEFRGYDPAIGRFTSTDPISQIYDFQTPYAANSPTTNIDFLGLAPQPDPMSNSNDDQRERRDRDNIRPALTNGGGGPPVGSKANPVTLNAISVTASKSSASILSNIINYDRFGDWESEGCGLSVGEIAYPSSPWAEGIKDITSTMLREPLLMTAGGGWESTVGGWKALKGLFS